MLNSVSYTNANATAKTDAKVKKSADESEDESEDEVPPPKKKVSSVRAKKPNQSKAASKSKKVLPGVESEDESEGEVPPPKKKTKSKKALGKCMLGDFNRVVCTCDVSVFVTHIFISLYSQGRYEQRWLLRQRSGCIQGAEEGCKEVICTCQEVTRWV